MENKDKLFSVIRENLALILILTILFLIIAPFIFTRPAIYDSFDFSITGPIGDTIGGITAPIVGLISILLLYATLKEQININKRQQKDNDFILLLNIQNQIQEINKNIKFEYYVGNADGNLGTGIFNLSYLDSIIYKNIKIANIELKMVLSQLSLMDASIMQFLKMNHQSNIERESKIAFYIFAQTNAQQIIYIYDLSIRNVIELIFSPEEIDPEDIFNEDINPLVKRKNDLEVALQTYKIE